MMTATKKMLDIVDFVEEQSGSLSGEARSELIKLVNDYSQATFDETLKKVFHGSD
jgi:hypothetical protein